MHYCKGAIQTNDEAFRSLKAFGKLLRGGGSSDLGVIVQRPPPGKFRRSAIAEALHHIEKNAGSARLGTS